MKQLEKFCLLSSSGNIQQLAYLSFLLTLFQQHQASYAFYIDERQSPSSEHWSYADQNGWQVVNKQCGRKAQSPIDIQRKNVIQSNSLKLQFFNYDQPTKFRLQNAHHTIKMDALILPAASSSSSSLDSSLGRNLHTTDTPNRYEQPDEGLGPAGEDAELELEFEAAVVVAPSTTTTSKPPLFGRVAPHGRVPVREQAGRHEEGVPTKPYNGLPSIKLDWLDDGNNEFRLRDIHFHWAERRDNGSEHAIDGRRAAMEMHLVHVKHGLDKSKLGFTSDSIAVVAVLIESYRKSNADFNPIMSALARVNSSKSSADIEYRSIYDLLPNELNSFYTYAGSLTTPPCYQVVNWIIMSDRLYLNAKQIEMFRNLYAPEPEGARLDPHQGLAAAASSNTNHQRHLHHDRPTSSSSSSNNHQHQQLSGAADQEQPATGESRAGREHYSPSNYNHQLQLIMPNVRQLQPLNNRTILASFAPLSRLEQIQEAYSPQGGAAGSRSFGQPASSLQVALLTLLVTFLLARRKSWPAES